MAKSYRLVQSRHLQSRLQLKITAQESEVKFRVKVLALLQADKDLQCKYIPREEYQRVVSPAGRNSETSVTHFA